MAVHGTVLFITWVLWLRDPTEVTRRVKLPGTGWAYFSARGALRLLIAARVSPSAITLMGLGCALLAGTLAAQCRWEAAGLWVLWSGVCDMLDGDLARRTGRVTAAGAFLDSVCDRLGEAAVIMGAAAGLGDRGAGSLAMVTLVASLTVSYARARGEGLGASACPCGGFERPVRLVCFIISFLLAGFVEPPDAARVIQAALIVVAAGATVTAVARVVLLYRALLAATPLGAASPPWGKRPSGIRASVG